MDSFGRIWRIRLFQDLAHLVFPNLCLSCERELADSEQHVCSFCTSNLTLTNFHLYDESTPMDQLFWGRVKVHKTYAHLFFEKNKVSQNILFNLKYKNDPKLGEYFGGEIGKSLRLLSSFAEVDGCIPVPLHPKKQFIRGYNQSETLARGLSKELNVALLTKVVVRIANATSQTKKSRFQRWENVQGSFLVREKIKSMKHVVLVDDVITTGSTIESIVQQINELSPNTKVSVVTLAIA